MNVTLDSSSSWIVSSLRLLAASAVFSFAATPQVHANEAKGNIKFTADNASQIFLNGNLLRDTTSEQKTQTDNWRKPFEYDNLILQQGRNVLGIAAWDTEGIAGISGEFKMPDETEFGTSDWDDWLVFDADIEKILNNTNQNFELKPDDPLSK